MVLEGPTEYGWPSGLEPSILGTTMLACFLHLNLGLECCVKWANKSRADWGQELSNLKWIREKRFLLSKLPSLERKGRLGI